MKYIHCWIALVGLIFAAPLAAALAPAPADDKKNTLPPIVIQSQSLGELIPQLREGMGQLLSKKGRKKLEKKVMSEITPENLNGLDWKRPFLAFVDPDASLFKGEFEQSRLVVMIPFTGEKEFIELLQKGMLTPEKKEDGVYKIKSPDFPIDISMRFLRGYAYIGIAGQNLDPELLPTPKQLIDEKEKAPCCLRINPDKLSPAFKAALLESLKELETNVKQEQLPASVESFCFSGLKMLGDWGWSILNESKQVNIRLLNEESGFLQGIEFEVIPKERTTLALAARMIPKSTNRFASLADADTVGHIFIRPPLYSEGMKNLVLKLLTAAKEEGAVGMEASAAVVFEDFIKLANRTVESGNIDAALVLRGPNKEKLYSTVGAMSLKDPGDFEKTLKTFITDLPQKQRDHFKLDAQKVEGLSVHEVDLSDVPKEEDWSKLFGKEQKILFAFGKDAGYIAYGPESTALIRAAILAKPGPAKALEAVLNPERFSEFLEQTELGTGGNESGKDMGKGIIEGFRAHKRKLTVAKLDIQGGESIKIQAGLPVLPCTGFLYVVLAGLFGGDKDDNDPVEDPPANKK